MTTAVATATEPERAFTAREAAALVGCSLDCAAAFAWRAVEEFEISLDTPRLCGGRWLAGCLLPDGRRPLEFGDTPVDAVRNVLRAIGEAA